MSTYNMNTRALHDLTKDQLINLIKNRIQPPTEFEDKPNKSVMHMVQDYEDNIIEPPLEFRDG